MKVKLKNLREQVIVITGASSGIGLVTARLAAKRGARVVLNARNQEALDQIKNEINLAGGEAIAVAGDVGEFEDVKRIADEAIKHFGGFDTWVNNAAVSIYGRLLDQPLEDQRRLFQTNYWGVVNGSMVATEHLRIRGGALINVGSVLSDRAIPIQGSYCASKHAVKGYTDALRVELEKERAPISVTLIKPSSIDTPYRHHARNFMTVEPVPPPLVYAPETVAEAILHCAENSMREVYVGGAGKALAESAHHAPRLTDKVMEAVLFDLQQTDQPKPADHSDSLYGPSRDGDECGGYPGHVAESSLYTTAKLHAYQKPNLWKGLTAGLAAGVVAGWVMNRFQAAWTRKTEGFEKPHGAQSMQPSMGEYEAEASNQSQPQAEDATVRTARIISEKVLGQPLDKRDERAAGAVVHYVFGIGIGALYGILAEVAPATATAMGLPFGAVFWLVADETVVPILGLSKGPSSYRGHTHVYALTSHLVYGATAELTRRMIRAKL